MFCTDGSPLVLWLYSSEQYSVHRFSICRSSVRHFPERSWTVVAFPCFTVIKSFTSWYALLLLFFLRFSSISLHFSPIQFSLVSAGWAMSPDYRSTDLQTSPLVNPQGQTKTGRPKRNWRQRMNKDLQTVNRRWNRTGWSAVTASCVARRGSV